MTLRNTITFMIRRLLLAIPLLIGVIVFNFLIIHAAPGDPVNMMVGEAAVSQEYVDRLRHEFGLDRPIHIQLGRYLLEVAQGNLGTSYAYRKPVLDIILSRIPATLLLMGTAFTLSLIIGVLLGANAPRRPGSLSDNLIVIFALTGYSTPVFWTGLIALIVFSVNLGWFPAGGMVNVRVAATGLPKILDIIHHLVLPVGILTIFNLALMTRLTRASMLEILRKDFITTAQAKGLTENRVLYRHALPNALLPVVTVGGLQFGAMLSGAILTETVFSWPGLGRLMFEAVGRRDFPVLLGMLIVSSFMVVAANLITDLIYVLINPRIRIQ